MAKAKSKSSKVTKKVETVKKSPPKAKTDEQIIDEIIKSLDEEWHHVVISAREISGNDLVKLRNEVQSAQARGGFNFSTILEEIDKYKIVSE
tara:strand:- start:809 stop:1084 length:276 start_codon:yes stop_codon:yes gene_type:complete